VGEEGWESVLIWIGDDFHRRLVHNRNYNVEAGFFTICML